MEDNMATNKNNRDDNFYSTHVKIIGQHAHCGGDVQYVSSPTFGYRVCEKCGLSTHRGAHVELATEQ